MFKRVRSWTPMFKSWKILDTSWIREEIMEEILDTHV